jgi:hypothetical protein
MRPLSLAVRQVKSEQDPGHELTMPFTFSHPAAVVPLARRGLPLSALVVGSIAPDLPYFIHLSTGNQFGHTLVGIFLFCVPAGLLVLWLFHAFLKLPLLSLLPANQQKKLAPVAGSFRFGPARHFLLILLSLVMGAATHIIWDSFTHVNAWAVQHLPILRWPIVQTSHGTLFVYKLLQHGSTVVGAALLLYWYARWLGQAPAQPVRLPVQLSRQSKTRLILSMIVVISILASIYGYWNLPTPAELPGLSGRLQLLVRNVVVAGVAVAALELFLFSLVWRCKARNSRGHLADLHG